MMNTSIQAQTPTWIDTFLYPFENRYIQLKAGRMHYVDEGEGEVLLFIHGTPSWSFLYRDFVKELSQDYRCIALDHLGFGLSEKSDTFSGTPKAHAENLAEFVEQLGLEKVTLVVHDFGGPIGLGWANQHPEKVKRIVLFNTWLWATEENPEARKADKMIRSWLGRFLYLHLNFSPKVLLKKGFAQKEKLSKEVHRQYRKPFPDKASRRGVYKIAQNLVGASAWYGQQWEKFAALDNRPCLILWGTEDAFFKREELERWRQRLPQAHVHTFPCGHFVQEEETRASINAIKAFLKDERLRE